MQKIFSYLSATFFVVILSGCAGKEVQPIQSLSNAYIGQVNVTEVNVEWGEIFKSKLEEERNELNSIKEKLAEIPEDPNRGQKSLKKSLESKLPKQERRIERMEESLVQIPQEVKTGIINALSEIPQGDKPVKLDVTINSFSLTNGAAVLLVGGSDSMSAVVNVTDTNSQETIGEYLISDIDQNAAGGLLGLMVRGADAKGDMIKQFSDKVAKVLYVEDKKMKDKKT